MTDSGDDPSFNADDISGPYWPDRSTTRFVYDVALTDGEVGHAVVPGPSQTQVTHESVAAALDFQVEGHGFEAVVEQLKHPDGLMIDPTLF
jgi:hypothetical protein